MVQPYVESLTQKAVNSIKLFHTLFEKTYPAIYKGLSFDITKERGKHLLVVFMTGDCRVRTRLTFDDGSMIDTTWKAFKRGLDSHLAEEVSCGICMEEWTRNSNSIPAFWGCPTCAKTVCVGCMKNIKECCPYCRASF
jgi:hypothetical protein